MKSIMRPSLALTSDRWVAALEKAILRLNPIYLLRNPIMFVVYCAAVFTTICIATEAYNEGHPVFTASVALCIWFTVGFANMAESVVEERGKQQTQSLRNARYDVTAKRIDNPLRRDIYSLIPATSLRAGDIVIAEAGDTIPTDGQVIKGIASVDESAITGESAPVIREPEGDRDTVTGGTRVLSDWIMLKVVANPGDSYLDRMIDLVQGAVRHKTPNETALELFLISTTILCLISVATLFPFSLFATTSDGIGTSLSLTVLVALLVCFSPTTIGGLISAIGIAGMNRLIAANVVATSGRAIEASGDISVILLDKTGTITLGNRQAIGFYPTIGVSPTHLVQSSMIASLADATPEGRSIIELAHKKYNIDPEFLPPGAVHVPFSADTRISGVIMPGRSIFKGADDAIEEYAKCQGGEITADIHRVIETIARQGGTPLLVCENEKILGVIHLKDIVKVGIKDRLASLRMLGVRSIMITGDNPLTAAAIAAEAGVDDFIAQATPETKLKYIRKLQEQGEIVAMVGDGTNDAPALAQSDVGIAMNNGTQSAREAANMIDLESNPTKLLEVVRIGRQLLMTRGALTTFSFANDFAKFFIVFPAVFINIIPGIDHYAIISLSSPTHALFASLLFNALIILFLIPFALRGINYRPTGANGLLRRNLFVFGLGGLIIPFIGIKLIDLILVFATRGGST